jgi:hypothetical protein
MKPPIWVLLFVALLSLCACEEVGYVEKANYDKLAQENADLKKQLAQKEEEIKNTPRHHYSLHREGFRTFRFDADTGDTCIQLTTTEDWKRKDTKSQSCDCKDLFAEGSARRATSSLVLMCRSHCFTSNDTAARDLLRSRLS